MRDLLEATLAMFPSDGALAADCSLRGQTAIAPQRELIMNTLDRGPPTVGEVPLILCAEPANEGGEELSVERLLGEGGMGKVVLATQRALRRLVAVKVANQGGEYTRAVLQEGVITGMLEHPNIPPIHSLGRDKSGQAVLVMKRIEGVTWAEVLKDPSHPLCKQSPLFAKDLLDSNIEILLQVCNALEFAHAQGVIHRDIKPANVMLGRYGEVYLIDWGVAFRRAWYGDLKQVSVVGTPMYMAPEMLLGELPDERTDVYLLGATLHEVLTGAAPHWAETLMAVVVRAFESVPYTYGAEVPGELATLCKGAMARDRKQRLPSVRAFREALQRFRVHRASMVLCAEAQRRAEELMGLLAEKNPDEGHVSRLQHECRFGFHQALREWPESEEARRGWGDLAKGLAWREVTLGNVRGARALLGEIPGGDEALARELQRLEAALLAAQQAKAARAEEARQMDVRNALRERNLSVGALLVMMSVLVIARLLWPEAGEGVSASHRAMINVWLLWLLVAGLFIFVGWRKLSVHAINRRWILCLVVFSLGMGLNRLVGWLYLPPPIVTLAADVVISASVISVASAMITRRLLWMLVPQLLGLSLMLALPNNARLVMNIQTILSLAVFVWVLRAQKQNIDTKSLQNAGA